MGAAMHRAAHQVHEHGRIFLDPLALPILGVDADTVAREARNDAFSQRLRMFIALRSRLAEDALENAVERGTRQLVVLGAGLDTFAYRSAFGDRLRIFEVDHPATQAWKRERLSEASIAMPRALTFAPVDFERQTLSDGLAHAGFDPTLPTFFTWLGVVPYLTEAAVFATLGLIASLPGGAHVVFDYANPPETLTADARAGHAALAARVAEAGEAFKTYLESSALHARLATLGFTAIEDLGPREIARCVAPGRTPPTADRGGHICRASALSPG